MRRSFPPTPREAHALVLRAHPLTTSFNSALAEAYAEGLRETGLSVELLDTDTLEFDPRLHGPAFGSQALEPDIALLQQKIARAAHLVIASPVWWGGVPAAFKGLIDRTLLPGWAYRTEEGEAFPLPGLVGRSGRVLLTMDSPGWWDRWTYGRCAVRMLDDAVLSFVGIDVLGNTRFTSIEKTTPETRAKMLTRARKIGRNDARRVLRRMQRAAASSSAELSPGRVQA